MKATRGSLDSAGGVSADLLIDALPFGVVVLGPDLRVAHVNSRYCELLETSAPSTLGRPVFELSNGIWNHPGLRASIEHIRKSKPNGDPVEIDVAGGAFRRLSVRVLGLPGAGNAGALLVVVDKADAIRGGDRPAAAADVGRAGDLIGRAAHELRGTLGSIANWVHLLSDGSKDGALLHQGLAAIRRALKAGTQVIDDLSDLSLLRRGRLQLRSGLVDLVTLLDLVLEAPRKAAQEKGVTLSVVREVQSQPVLGDPDRLQQILLHLLNNAVRFTPSGGAIDVVFDRDSAAWRLTVRDTGCGIAAESLPRLFDGDAPAGRNPAQASHGLGVGLSIVRHLAALHGGAIEASSPGPGQGACFVLRLPIPALVPASSSRPLARPPERPSPATV